VIIQSTIVFSMDSTTTLQELKEAIRKFCEERDWDQYHNPKDLAIGIITEASELLEHFLWKSEKDVAGLVNDPAKKEQIEDEMADVLYFLLRLSEKYNIDLSEALLRKIQKNAKKYPVEKAKGSSKKYTELGE